MEIYIVFYKNKFFFINLYQKLFKFQDSRFFQKTAVTSIFLAGLEIIFVNIEHLF